MEYFCLNNGMKIPAIGTGTNTFGKPNDDFKAEPNNDFTPLINAIDQGYELFDTATAYGNEVGLGQVFANCSTPREKLFITGKLPARSPFIDTPDSVRNCVINSLEKLNVQYFDLFMLHQPLPIDKLTEVWGAMESLVSEGLVKAIGVSNFNVEQMQSLFTIAKIKPAVNQVRRNPCAWNTEVIEFCKENDILPMGHSPLNFSAGPGVVGTNLAYKDKLIEVAEKHGKSWAQILLRYNYERGVVTIPKSSNPANQIANLQIFDFSLTEEDYSILGVY